MTLEKFVAAGGVLDGAADTSLDGFRVIAAR
jgi:hypothetical protein